MGLETKLVDINSRYGTQITKAPAQSMLEMGFNATLQDREGNLALADYMRQLNLALLLVGVDNQTFAFPPELENLVNTAIFSNLLRHEYYNFTEDQYSQFVQLCLSEPGMFVFHEKNLDSVKFRVIKLTD